MAEKKKSLGRNLGDLGLSELLGSIEPATAVQESQEKTEVVSPPPSATSAVVPAENRIFRLSVAKLNPGRYQPRTHFDETALQDLASSIRAQGIIQPLVVRRHSNGYEIIAGERRWRAAQMAGLEEVPAIIQDLPDEAMMAIALIENIQREDLNAIEEAVALDRLLNEYQLTHQQVAEAVGKSRAAVTNLMRLLKLNPDVRMMLEKGHLDMGHARALLSLEGVQQSEMADMIFKKGWSVRQTEQAVRDLSQAVSSKAPVADRRDPNISRLENDLSDKLSARVMIKHQAKGKGQLVIHYSSVDELDGILEHIN